MTLPNFKLKIVAKQPVCSDATAVLKDTANNTILTEAIPSGATENIIAPNATVNLNGSAFISPRSNQTVNVTTIDQNNTTLTPSVSGSQLTFNIDYNTLIRFQLEAGQTDSVLYTVVNNVNNGSYTATTNDGSSGTITFSKNGGAFAAFSSPLVLASGDTIRVRRTTATTQGWVQITGTY